MGYSYGFEKVIAKLKARAQMLADDVVEQLDYTGEEAINRARQTGDYLDQTKNLRSSIGYEVLVEGVKETGGTTLEEVGPSDPEKVKEEVQDALRQHKKGAKNKDISLVIVAGMEYGKYLEHKGYTVTKTAFLEAEQNFKRRMKTLRKEFTEDVKKILK